MVKIRTVMNNDILYSKHLIFYVLIIGLLPLSLRGQQKHIYLANDNHTDYFWTANDESYSNVAINEIDYYLNLTESTLNLPLPHQNRYNLDCAWYVYEYQQNKSPEDFQVLIDRIKSGHMSMPLNWLVSTYGGQPTEAVIRGMYWPGKLARDYDLDISLAVSMENQTQPLGLASLWAGSGARYSWKGVCSCASTVLPIKLAHRNHEIYKYSGLDGQGVLMKWYSWDYHPYGLGGYAEAWDLSSVFTDCIDKCNTDEYPYNIVAAFGHAGDALSNTTDVFHNFAVDHSDEENQIYVSNEADFFEHVESNYGIENIPVEALSYGNEWDLNCATLAPITAKMRNAVEKLRTAEALASIISLEEADFYSGFETEREQAWRALGSFWDHNFGLGGCCYPERNEWQISLQQQVSNYADQLFLASANALGHSINKSSDNTRFFVFNSLGWLRSGYVDVSYTDTENIKIIDITTGAEVPFQILPTVEKLRIHASDIPAVGYKVYEIQTGESAGFPMTATLGNSVFENDNYRLSVTSAGVITSLVDKDQNEEFVQEENNLFLNDFGQGNAAEGNLTLLNNGPVSATIRCESPNPLQHTTDITLYKHLKRIDIENEINQEFGSDIRAYTFSFNLEDPTIWHEELGAILKAKYQESGGHYANADLPVRYDWLTLNHFADIGNSSKRVTLSNKGAAFMKPGNSLGEFLDENSNQIHVMIGGVIQETDNPYILNQYGLTTFNNDFALVTYDDVFDAKQSMKFALEHQNPLVAGYVQTTGNTLPEDSFSLVQIDNPELLLWTLKPAEDGINDGGLILRFWNMDTEAQPGIIDFAGEVLSAKKTTHLETDRMSAMVEEGKLNVNIGQQKMETFRVFLDELIDSIPKNQSESNINIFPNPNTTGNLRIEAEGYDFPITLKIYTPKGQLLVEEKIHYKYHDLQINDFPSGLLLFTLESNGQHFTKKVLITK
jgi:alpha-mannosidase